MFVCLLNVRFSFSAMLQMLWCAFAFFYPIICAKELYIYTWQNSDAGEQETNTSRRRKKALVEIRERN